MIDNIVYAFKLIILSAVIVAVVLFFAGVMEPLRHIQLSP